MEGSFHLSYRRTDEWCCQGDKLLKKGRIQVEDEHGPELRGRVVPRSHWVW